MGELKMKNYMEDCVEDMIDSVLNELTSVCKCEKCCFDITAMALNMLKPKYVVTKKGQFYTKLSALQNQYDVDVISAITRAAVIVSKNPRHDVVAPAPATEPAVTPATEPESIQTEEEDDTEQ